jgi:hypothetical protein
MVEYIKVFRATNDTIKVKRFSVFFPIKCIIHAQPLNNVVSKSERHVCLGHLCFALWMVLNITTFEEMVSGFVRVLAP